MQSSCSNKYVSFGYELLGLNEIYVWFLLAIPTKFRVGR